MRFLLLLGSFLASIGVSPVSANPYQGIRYEVSEGRVYEHLSGNLSIAASTASWSTHTITLEGESGVIHAETINVKHLTVPTMTAANVVATSGTFSGSLTAGTLTAGALYGDGSNLTGVIHSTTSYLADGVSLALTGATFSAKSSSVTLQGNSFNGASQLVKLDALSKLPAVDGSQLTNLPSTSGGAVLASTQTFTGQNTFSAATTMSSVTVTGNLHNKLTPFAWVEFDSTAGPSILASVNVSSITYMGTAGRFMVNFDENFTGAAYASICSASIGDPTTIFHCVNGPKYATGQEIGIYGVYSLGGDISLSNNASHVSVVFYGVR